MKKVLTVDFDSTLADTVSTGWNGTALKPVTRVINFVFDKVRSGEWEAHIVSFRAEKDRQEIIDFVKGWKIPITTIICTEYKNKTPFLKKLNSKLHIDDDVQVCMLAFMAGIDCLLVDHGQEKNNSTVELFPKI